MSISPHHTGFRNISSLLAESKLKITRDVSLAIEETNNFQSLGPGDPNSIFADGPASVARTVDHEGTGFVITYEFTNEGKRPLNKITFQFSAGHADNIKIQLSEDGVNFTQLLGGQGEGGSTFTLSDDLTYTNGVNGGTMANAQEVTVIFNARNIGLGGNIGQFTEDITGNGVRDKLIFYKAFQIFFESDFDGSAVQTGFKNLQIFEEFAYALPKQKGIEFNDSILDLAGWKNSRYLGSKLTGQRINQFNIGDITYGKNPVVSNKVAAVYIGNSVVGGDTGPTSSFGQPGAAEEPSYTRIIGHSYANISKILLIDLETDDVEIIESQNIDPIAFKRFVDKDFPEGSQIKFKLLDRGLQNNLKQNYFVKFNRGSLQRLYTYTANTGGFEDGVFGGFGLRNNRAPNQPGVLGSGVFTGSIEGPGLFGYGQTAAESRSLFNATSIHFVDVFPPELNEYNDNINLDTIGFELAPLTASVVITPFGGSDSEAPMFPATAGPG